MSSLFLPLGCLVFGLALGAIAAWFAARAAGDGLRRAAEERAAQASSRASEHAAAIAARGEELQTLRKEQNALREEAESLRVAHARLETELHAARTRHAHLENELARSEEEENALRRELCHAQEQSTRFSTALESERSAAAEKLAMLLGAREELGNQFKALANDILEEKSRHFTDQNRTSIDQLLTPLRDRLGEFQQKVEALKEDGIAGRSELKTHIDGLRTLNERLSAEASSLVSALKGSSKTQGDWGEVLLERMLEDAGLRKGEEYRVQESFTREDGSRARPDVVLNMPGDKHLVIDAKVSLLDYNAYCECADEAGQAVSLARHVGSMREHVRGLSKRKYQALYDLQSIDFVVMFVPIEPAYLLALAKDGKIWQEAWASDVLLVSPGTLFPVIRTVAHLWRQEQQNRNVQEIVYRGGELYDKLAAFTADLVKIGDGIDNARASYDKALGKLRTGKGNAIRQAEMLKALGVKPSKQLPREMLESLEDELVRTLVEDTDMQAGAAATPLDNGGDTLFE
jgi:DNA recombination protein RmuC